MFRRTGIMVVAALIMAAGVVPVAVASSSSTSTSTTAASAAAPYCGIRWGSLAKSASPLSQAQLTNIRAGRHACFDRLVFDVRNGNVAGYRVNYVSTMRSDGSGHVIPLRGGAKLSIAVNVPAYDTAGRMTYRVANPAELVNVTGYRTFRQVAWAGSYEGYTTAGLGVRAKLPFRVFKLPGRLVVDVAHRW
jgi:hypothetical protein